MNENNLDFFRNKKSDNNIFNDQFDSKISSGDLDIFHVKPEDTKSDEKVLLAPGWARGVDSLKNPIRTLFNEGREVISVGHARIGGKRISEKQEYTKVESIKAASLMTAIEKTQQEGSEEKIGVIAHSEGCINSIIAALENPEKFNNLVLVAPAGMIGEDNFSELKERFNSEKDREREVEGEDFKKNKNFLKYAAKNLVRSVNEVKAISKIQIQGYLKILKDQGIGISIISGVDDKAFPMDRMQKIANSGMIDGFYSIKDGHNKIYSEPEKYMKAALEALRALEAKNSK